MKMAILVATFGTVLSIAAIMRAGQTAPASQPASPSWGDAVNGLQMSISQDQTAQGPNAAMHFIVSFHNTGKEDEVLVTGGAVCGVQRDASAEVRLNLVDPQGTQHRHLPWWGNGPPYKGGVCGGVIGDPFLVTLHPGRPASLPLFLEKYFDFSDSKAYGMARFPAGTYMLQADLTRPGVSSAQPKYWFGAVKSNVLQIHFDSEFAAPLGDIPK
ncbi:MAG TPA: hypothetical protein VG322_17060 [Candidatus Acidoferrales bacterium]|jgi:hypothetical protein|nr:hypothetical protein [Candidatus Acidoferrales bacterium]